MQSLVLATSILLSSQNPVIATDVATEVASFVQGETNRVTQLISQQQVTNQNLFLQHTQPLIRQANLEQVSNELLAITAE